MNSLAAFSLAALLLVPMFSQRTADLSKYNAVWVSRSKDSLDSMPLSGRFGAGANVWVQNGSVWIYPPHNGAYDEEGCLLKLGRLRITPARCGRRKLSAAPPRQVAGWTGSTPAATCRG